MSELTPAEDAPATTSTAEAPPTETTEAAPEAPAPPEAPQPQGDVRECGLTAKGTFDKGIADLKVEEGCDIEFDRTQLLILVKDKIRYTFTRTNIEPIS